MPFRPSSSIAAVVFATDLPPNSPRRRENPASRTGLHTEKPLAPNVSHAETKSGACSDKPDEKSGTFPPRDRRGAKREWRKQWPKDSPGKHEDVPAGETEFEVDQGLVSAARGAAASGDDSGGEVRSAVGAFSGRGAGAATGEEVVEGLS